MPFKHRDAEFLEYDLLCLIFRHVPTAMLGTLALVSKRWRSVATDPSWKPDLLVLAWGHERFTGLDMPSARPTPLPLAAEQSIVQIVCADAATLALTAHGDVWHWGQHWIRRQGVVSQPTRLEELRDVQSIACSVPGYYHERRMAPGYHCAAITRGNELYTWGINVCGQLLRRHVSYTARPERVTQHDEVLGAPQRVLLVACGCLYTCVHVGPAAVGSSAQHVASADVDQLSIKELKALIQKAGLSSDDCLDKMELKGRARMAVDRLASLPADASRSRSQVYTCGSFCRERPHELTPWTALSGLALRQLEAGAFHCCCVTAQGDLYTWGHQFGLDHANGNLLGHGSPPAATNGPVPVDGHEVIDGLEVNVGGYSLTQGARLPRRVLCAGLGPVTEVRCSTYCTLAITVDGRAFTWGDSDGDALGHSARECHVPTKLDGLAGLRATHGAVCYTNGAVALADGSIFVWGGGMWEGGIGGGTTSPTRVACAGVVPPCYKVGSVALAHRHGYLLLRKEP